MPRKKRAPELTFQKHIADFLVRVHRYGVLEQADISDTEHCIAEEQLWAFLRATQADQLKKLTDEYSTDAREEVFRALRKELEHTPLWMIPEGVKIETPADLLAHVRHYADRRQEHFLCASVNGANERS